MYLKLISAKKPEAEVLSATNHGQSHGEHEGNVELPWGEVRVYVNSVLIAKSSKQFQDYGLAADFPEAPIQNKIEIALFGNQFTCFTGTKVQILTQKAWQALGQCL